MTAPTELLEAAAAGFRSRFNQEPDGIWSAPGRVNLIGEHTDYNGGFVLPFAIDRRTVVALRLRDDRIVRVASSFAKEAVEISLDELIPENLHGWSAYPLGVAWALGQFGADLGTPPVANSGKADGPSAPGREPVGALDGQTAEFPELATGSGRGFEAYIESDVPVGAGLSSSAAIESAVGVALNDCWELGFDRRTLARVGQLAENRVVGAPTGIMDQSASLLGERDAAVFLDCRDLASEVVPLGFDEAGLELLIIDTKVDHAHATGGYGDRRRSCEAGAAALGVELLRDVSVDDLPRAAELLDEETFRRVRHVVTEDQRVLDTVHTLREGGPRAIGPLLDASHVSMRDDFEISVPELDVAVDAARAGGAIGARMTGGGFGGSAIALTPHAQIPAVTNAVLTAFAERGFRAPELFVVHAADGARREK
ncbi:galactokinase [Cryobacterium tepidiphilum]|uniref:Galactokinase n=1 Tax=Cryobacterium tepidiphilum TaxID=2486026 RepID=A0A3M8LF03_9MICO|nr:galactokinase [Cryobacterium tepidiphilum]RNE64030.1 galactokinase [Cryobacterium tepidiphilum]